MMMMVVMVFGVCWLPYQVYFIIGYVYPDIVYSPYIQVSVSKRASALLLCRHPSLLSQFMMQILLSLLQIAMQFLTTLRGFKNQNQGEGLGNRRKRPLFTTPLKTF